MKQCLDLLQAHVDLREYALVVEPSAGDGAFFRAIPAELPKVGIDIDPRLEGLVHADFFEWRPTGVKGPIVVLGNPPFGQRGALAVRFIEHAATFADVIAFVLPRSFNKYTFMNRVPLNFELLGSFDCDDFYLVDGTPAKVKCVFQVWRKTSKPRAMIAPRSDHPDLKLCHCHLSRTSAEKLAQVMADYPYSIPQVGANFRVKPSSEVRAGSHWFIKPASPRAIAALQGMEFGFLDGMNTAFMSLSKKDIIRAYEESLERMGVATDDEPPADDGSSQLEMDL